MDGSVPDGDRRWLKRYGKRDGPAEIRLLCFHHAGGSAAMYRSWPGQLPPYVEPVAVQLPGRADRFREPAYERMTPLIDDLVDVLKPLLDRPYACYGVSMGARVAWTLAHTLRGRAMPMPRVLFVAACPAPRLDDDGKEWRGREEDLAGFMRELGGTPPEVLDQPEMLKVLLPTLRADMAVLNSPTLRPTAPLNLRIRAFAGADDPTAPAKSMGRWRTQTLAGFDLDVIPGGHFFDADGERRVIDAIAGDLARALAIDPAGHR